MPRLEEINLENKKITIVGTGQMASAVIYLLTLVNKKLKSDGKEGLEISLLGRRGSKSLAAFEQGINIKVKKVSGAEGEEVNISPEEFKIITDDITQIAKGQDYIFLLTKNYNYQESKEIFDSLRVLKKSDTIIVMCQNGIGFNFFYKEARTSLRNRPIISLDPEGKLLTSEADYVVNAVLCLACTQSANRLNSFVLITPLDSLRIPMGRPNGGREDKNFQGLVEIFKLAEVSTDCRGNSIIYEQLLKLQVNLTFNTLCTIYGESIGGIIEDRDYRITAFAISESLRLAVRRGFNLELLSWVELKQRLRNSLLHPTSMRLDFEQGKILEIASLCQATLDVNSILVKNLPIASDLRVVKVVTSMLKTLVADRDKLISYGSNASYSCEMVRVRLNYDPHYEQYRSCLKNYSNQMEEAFNKANAASSSQIPLITISPALNTAPIRNHKTAEKDSDKYSKESLQNRSKKVKLPSCSTTGSVAVESALQLEGLNSASRNQSLCSRFFRLVQL